MATAELPQTTHLTFESKRELLALLARDAFARDDSERALR